MKDVSTTGLVRACISMGMNSEKTTRLLASAGVEVTRNHLSHGRRDSVDLLDGVVNQGARVTIQQRMRHCGKLTGPKGLRYLKRAFLSCVQIRNKHYEVPAMAA